MLELTLIQKIAVGILPIVLAVTVHEAAHGYVANRLGDATARMLGRLTLNPIKHIDPLGTIVVPLLMFIFTPFVFGWAKPVPVNARNLHRPRRDMFLVAVAGPVSNLVMAVIWALITLWALHMAPAMVAEPLALMGQIGVFINIVLAVFNLLPLLPLDGGRMLAMVLPPRLAYQYEKTEPWGLPIVVLLLITGVLSAVLVPVIAFFIDLFAVVMR